MRAKCCHVLRAKSYSAHANLACIIQLSLQYRFTVFEYNPRSLIQHSGQAQSPKDHLISLLLLMMSTSRDRTSSVGFPLQ